MSAAPFEGTDDAVLPFAVEPLDVRGRIVRLGSSIDTIISRHGYPDAVSRVLGEAAALTVLLGSSLKFQGRFQLQTKTDGPIEMIVVDFDAPDRLRATARFDQERLDALIANGPKTGDLIGSGYLAMTIDQGTEQSRYQGVVALQGQGFEEAAHEYFRQSEQIPTRVRLAVAEQFENGKHTYRAGGLMVQFLPTSPDRMRQADLSPGDIPEGHPSRGHSGFGDDDAWAEAKALVQTVEDHELIDPAISSERLLYRLFHERGVRVFDGQSVHEECRCSEARVMSMMRRFSPEDRRDMVGDNGRIGITCEFCSRFYDLDPVEVEAEIARAGAE
ncbi:Hsp33 family molecular chaperone [Microvirga brassicacearum]|uniref:Hsp33 family molecular chaperone n=1 Tax=Microvirga brassicacearum TaxID=2580413 RepID=A0A5N3PHC1_9HYPH|nr:Hsp33 family molecular chaperone [Microvirga brassicacearum]KAB0269116.1 Hsp33 family molecular chaperone [Microvirga brassicacearum]